ncbi:hypothetical protein GCM10009851_40520 [Herbiconiux moechotypicola]|uniref:Uncharacterized protein n=1 Tax=Herbiconiux moechotypicola TaxID=637393 RepID=A0ABN3E8J8_9MICO
MTVEGISGCSASISRTRASNTANDLGCGDLEYLGGESDATAFTTVVLEIPNLAAI